MGTVLQLPDRDADFPVGADAVSVGYLEALGARMIEGRFFDSRDTPDAATVAIVNESAARRLWPGQSAIGKSVLSGKKRIEIVGVVGDVRRSELETPPGPVVYYANLQNTMFRANNLVIRAERNPRALLPAIRSIMRQVDPDQAVVRVRTLQERIDEVTAPRRFVLQLVGTFSLIALGLAMIGIYGVVAESVARRVPEIGIRMALGATARDVTTMILRQGVAMLIVGTVLGVMAAVALRGVMSSFVFGIPTTDPPAYIIACLCLTIAAVAACVIPSRRAARIDPVLALRQE